MLNQSTNIRAEVGATFRKARCSQQMPATQASSIAQVPVDQWLRFELGMQTSTTITLSSLNCVAEALKFRIPAVPMFKSRSY